MKFLHFFVCMVLLVSMLSCSEDAKQGTRIPPLPGIDAQKRIETSIGFLSRAIKRRPSIAQNYGKRAECYLLIQQYNEALTDINKALDINPNNGLFLLTRAKVLRQFKRYDQALADAQKAEVLNQDTPELYTLLGDLSQQKGRYPQAKLYLAKALQIAPYNGDAYFYSGTLTARQGDTASAIVLMQRALELKPRFLEPYAALTAIHTQLHEYPQAMAYNSAGLRYFPEESSLHYTRGVMYQTKRRLDSALICYEKAILFDSTNYLANFQAGVIYLKWNSLERAVQNLGKVARLNPQFPQINLLLGTAFDKLGNVDKALEQYTLATQLNPRDYKAQASLARAQRRKYYIEIYGYLPPAEAAAVAEETTEAPVETKTLDTARVRINVLQPRLQIRTKTDSGRTFKIKQ
ncbi:MAG: UDP-N-acetylglucosamine-peptide N-acetylglucosaminyltransferase [Runella slithyformis]|nr:MAG: UDP-N-acetylglucosamine-peptide N-acetylglucosaminyltransferase [Runella slithyformis]